MRVGVDNIPPVTLGLVGLMTAAFLDPPGLPFSPNPAIHCVSAERVLGSLEVWPLVLHAFVHLSDMHLYYNLSSLLWKGRQLERQLGTAEYAPSRLSSRPG